MRTYTAPYCENNTPDWSTVPVAAIDHYLWSDVRSIVPQAQLCWNENALFVRLQAKEQHIRREYTGQMDMVCEDSCLEFFFSPHSDDTYFNFEANPNGSLYVGYGLPGASRCRLYRANFKELFNVTPFETADGWGIELTIPADFVKIFVPDFSLTHGQKMTCNFFKCGDLTVQEHYMAWNKVELPTPNFHRPDFFGKLLLK